MGELSNGFGPSARGGCCLSPSHWSKTSILCAWVVREEEHTKKKLAIDRGEGVLMKIGRDQRSRRRDVWGS